VAALAPLGDALADAVDLPVLFDPVLRPLGVEYELPTAFLGGRDRDEVGTDAAIFDDLVGDAVIGELEVPARLLKGGELRIGFSMTTSGTMCSFSPVPSTQDAPTSRQAAHRETKPAPNLVQLAGGVNAC
jgi:hypothetical protein